MVSIRPMRCRSRARAAAVLASRASPGCEPPGADVAEASDDEDGFVVVFRARVILLAAPDKPLFV
jgi:hypothetical protein